MTILKKLLLTTFLASSLGIINANDDQKVFDFAITLSHQEHDDAQAISQWLINEINNDSLNNQALLIINSHKLTTKEKIEALAKIKPTSLNKYSQYVYSKMKTGLTTTAKFTAKLTALIMVPAIITASVIVGHTFITELNDHIRYRNTINKLLYWC